MGFGGRIVSDSDQSSNQPQTTELTAEQRRCVALLRDGARLDVLDRPKAAYEEIY
jgi:hypothetical protein